MFFERKYTCFVMLLFLMTTVLFFQNNIGNLVPLFYIRPKSIEYLKENIMTGKEISELVPCNSDILLNLENGSVYANTTAPSWHDLYQHTAKYLTAGHYRPTSCITEYRTAVIIPYRNRDYNLRTFLQHIHPFLQRQRIEYKIFVIEQMPGDPFNRGFLLNVGVVEAIKSDNFSCFILHDVDMLPEDKRNLYACGYAPIHMATSLRDLNYSLPYENYFGGVSAMTKQQFLEVNGFSNVYFGWGKEDDDLRMRIKFNNMKVMRGPKHIGRYTQVKHKQQQPIDGETYIRQAEQRMEKDGLNSLRYEIIKQEDRVLFLRMMVSLNKTELRRPWYQQTVGKESTHISNHKAFANETIY